MRSSFSFAAPSATVKVRAILFCAAIASVWFWSSPASAVSYVYEPFNYTYAPATDVLGQVNTYATPNRTWLQAGTSIAANIELANGSLINPTVTGDLVAAVGNSATINGGGASVTDRLYLGTNAGPSLNNTNTIYYSFLLNASALTGSNSNIGGYFFALNNTGNTGQTSNPTITPGRVQARIDPTDGTKFSIGVFNQRTVVNTDTNWYNGLTVGDTYFIVGAITINNNVTGPGGGTNPYYGTNPRLWVNPDPNTFGLSSVPPADRTDTTAGSGWQTGIQSILLRQSPSPWLGLDEIRVGNTWADVTPISTPTLYWDIDGDTPGAGDDATPEGTWDGTNAFWTNDPTGAVAGQVWTSGANAVFSAGSDATDPYTITVSGTQSATSVTFKDGTVRLEGDTLNLTGAHTLSNNSAQTATVATVIGGTAGLNKDGTGTVVLTATNSYSGPTTVAGGTLQLGDGGTTGTLPTGSAITTNATLTFNRSNDVTQGTDFSGSPIAGTGGITQAGGGTLTLNAANTFSGTTRAMTGTLKLSNSLALQNSTLDLNGTDTGTVVLDSSLSALSLGGLTGSRDLALTVTPDANYDGLNGVDTADYLLWEMNPGSFGGDPDGYDAWRAKYGNASGSAVALTIGGVSTTAGPYTGVLSGAGSTVTKVGTGTQILSGLNTYNGGTTINAGTLQFAKTNAMPQTGTVTVNSGGTLAVNADDSGNGEWSELPTDPLTGGTIGSLIAGRGGQGTAGQIIWNTGSAMAIDTTNTVGGSMTYTGVVGSFHTGGTPTDNVGFTKLGSNSLTLTNNNTFAGPLSIANNGGTLVLTGTNANAGSIMATPTVSIGNGNTTTLKLLATNAIPANSLISFGTSQPNFQMYDTSDTDPAFDQTVRGITGSNGHMRVGLGTLTINVPTGESHSWTGVIDGPSNGNGPTDTRAKIIKTGPGQQDLTQFMSGWDGEFIINQGTIGINNQQAFGDSSSGTAKLTLNGGKLVQVTNLGPSITVRNIEIGGSFEIDPVFASNIQFIGLQGLVTTTLTATNPTLTIDPGTGGVVIFAGKITDDSGVSSTPRGFTKAGTGTLLLANVSNDYKGETTIQQGTLRIAQAMGSSAPAGYGRLGDPTAATNYVNLSGGTLQYNGTQNDTTHFGTTTDPRIVTIDNKVRVTADSAVTTASTVANLNGVNDISIKFTNDSIDAVAGKLTFRNDRAGTLSATVFRPEFSGSGFDFDQLAEINNGASPQTTVLTSSNTTATQTWSGVLSGTGSFRRNGAGGTTVLSGDNTYSGGTTVDAGTLLVNNTSGSGSGSGAVAVNTGGTLGGTGALTGAVTVNTGGTLAPGASIDSFDIGALTMNTGTFAAELDSGASPSVGADLLNVTGALNIVAGSILDLSDLGGATLSPGTEYTLISYSGSWDNGIFNDLVTNPIPDDSTVVVGLNSFTIDYNDTTGGSNFGGGPPSINYVTLTVPGAASGGSLDGNQAVPEPAAIALLLFGVAALGMRRTR